MTASQIPEKTARRPWVVITDYPGWPSPYFAALHRCAPPELGLRFYPDLDDLDDIADTTGPGVINLHRLKRLYRDLAGTRTMGAAQSLLDRLVWLRARGWRLVWTVHNLLPIDGTALSGVDKIVTDGVLAVAEVILCHTNADARVLAQRTAAQVVVTGWAGLGRSGQPASREVAGVVASMRSATISVLLLGHVRAYKNVPTAVASFLAHTRSAHLTVAGTCPDPHNTTELTRLAASSSGRVSMHLQRIPPEQAWHLYAAAHAAVCPYRSDGPFGFFTEVLHPSSVGTAVCFGVPVIAPSLPSIVEMTSGRPRWLAGPDDIGPALAAAETDLDTQICGRGDPRGERPAPDADHRWRQITRRYHQVAARLAR
ncbi:MAG: glycosyltransferase [Pseudonocardiaceae bacterium]